MQLQAFGRACLTLFSAVVMGVFLTACDNDGSVKSPDLPAPTVSAITVSCPDNISVGASAQCTAECTVNTVNSNGTVTTTVGDCPGGGTWNTDCSGLTVDGFGNITGVSPGTCNVTLTIEDVISPNEQVVVEGLGVSCSVIYPAGTEIDPGSTQAVPGPVCDGMETFADRTIEVPVGSRVPMRVAARLTDGTLCYAPDAPAGQTACAPNLITFFTSDANVANFPDPTDGIAAAVATGVANLTATGTLNAVVMTVRDFNLESTLCVEPLLPQLGCQPYGTATVVCEGTATTPNIPVGGDFQFRARAFFDVSDGDSNTGLVCDVTNNANTTWSIADVGSEATANPTVNSTGLVSGGSTATNGATVAASFDLDGNGNTTNDIANGNDDFNVVDSLVLAANSVAVTANTIDPADPNFTRAACIGSYDLVSGLAAPEGLPAERGFFATTRKCAASALDSNNACPDANLDNTTFDDVSNAEGGNQAAEADGTITWTVEPGYWDGTQCVLGTSPLGGEPEAPTVFMGDNDAGARYTDGAVFTGAGDARVYAAGTTEDNGQVESLGPVRLATNCVTATYNATDNFTNQAASSRDGLTLVILPVTNDSLLGDPSASGAVELCNTLVPLFNLGASPGGANGAVIQAVASVASLLNTVTVGLDENIPLDDIVTQLITALNPITGPLSDAVLTPILTPVNDGVYAPLNCLIGEILKGVATQDPAQADVQACVPGNTGGGGGGGANPLAGTPLEALGELLAPLFGLQDQNPLPIP